MHVFNMFTFLTVNYISDYDSSKQKVKMKKKNVFIIKTNLSGKSFAKKKNKKFFFLCKF